MSSTEPAVGRPGLAGWPVSLVVSGRRVVVVGGGRVAARKIAPLIELGAEVVVVAPDVVSEIAAWADTGRLTVIQRDFAPDDLDGAWLAIAATGTADVNATVYAAGEERRVWVNAADDPARCSFTLMSLVRRADLVVAIGTGGRSPALAAWLRQRIADRVAEEVGPEYEVLLDLLSEAREALREAGGSSEDADWRRALDGGILDLVRAGRVDEARELLKSCL